ncbi:MAG: right-handed parallel beta-helix repeat-containing protein [Pirellulaceae bacterium]|nr:right-handed parallel beta-helix repeat-containing protein [Pirellulaceae bacterium]
MRTLVIAALVLRAAAARAPAAAGAGALYVDDNGPCGGNSPCYPHPQDAVNAAAPGDTIRVYPGVYGSREYRVAPPHYSNNDIYAPALIVYKDGLTITAVDPSPAATIIQTTHPYWSNPVAIQASTGGQWVGGQYVDAGVNPVFGTAPNAISIIASNVTIEGFTVRRPYAAAAGGHDTILIGGLYAGYGRRPGEHLGADGNTIKACVMDGGGQRARNGVSIWHSTNTLIQNNTIVDPQWSAINLYDGASNAEVALDPPSTGSRVIGNTVVDNLVTAGLRQGIFVGAWNTQPTPAWTDNAGTRVHANDFGGLNVVVGYSLGEKRFAGNRAVDQYLVYHASDYFFPPNPDPGQAQRVLEQTLLAMNALEVGPPPDFDTSMFPDPVP